MRLHKPTNNANEGKIEQPIASLFTGRGRTFAAVGKPVGFRVVRGGSWNNNNDRNLRVSNRNNNNPDNRNNNIGFRLARHLARIARVWLERLLSQSVHFKCEVYPASPFWAGQIHRLKQGGLKQRPSCLFSKDSMKEAKESIVNKAYDLLKTAVPLLNMLPRNHKFTYGDRVQNHLSELLECLIRAFYAPPVQKKELLQEANVDLEVLRHYIRLGFDLNLLKASQYHDLSRRIDEIGRMVGGWLKSLK